MPRQLPSFDLVVATVGREAELGYLLDSLGAHEDLRLRVLVVDQNDDDRIAPLLEGRGFDVVHLRAPRGLSRARNEALGRLTAEVVAFPDDDCTYPAGLLSRIAARFADDSTLDGLTGRAEDESGRSSPSWRRDATRLTDDNLWNRAISFTIFLRREVVTRVGGFDEQLGLGSHAPWSSGEEIDYLIRAVRAGARIEYDPSLVVRHNLSHDDDAAIGFRDGASVGHLLRKHGYGPRTVVRMLMRPAGGIIVSLARLDRSRAAYRWATLRGRLHGYLGARDSKSSA